MILDEKTEVTIPLKILVTVISFVVISSWYVSTTQNRIGDLEHRVQAIEMRFDAYTKAPARNQLEVELLKKDFDYIKKEIEKLK